MEAFKIKLNINTNNIIPKTLVYTLGIIIFFSYWHFFGVSNAIVGFLVVNSSALLFHKDLTSYPIKNIIRFLFIYLFIGVFSFLAACNIYVGFIINFFAIFFMVYALFYDFKTTILPPFLFAYLILLKDPVSFDELPKRLLGLVIGAFFLIISQFILNYNKSKKELRTNLIGLVKEISVKIDGLISNKDIRYDYVNIEKYIDNILTIINERKDNFFYIGNVDNIRLNFALYVERLNYSLDELEHPTDDEIYIKFLKDLEILMSKIIRFIETEDAIYLLILEVEEFTEKYANLLSYNYSAYEIIQNMAMLRFSLSNFENETKNSKFNISNYIPLPTSLKLKNILNLNFNFKSLKFTYAFRLAFLISTSYFIVKFLNVPFGYWVTITLYAVVQPYAETSKQRFFLRFKGTIIGIALFMIITLFIPTLPIRVTIYLSLYYIYLFLDDYDNKTACLTTIVLGVFVLLGDNAYETSLYRFIYMAIGILIGYLGTKYLFPYNTIDSINRFTESYIKLSETTISYAFKNNIDEDLLKELNNRLLVGKLYEDKLILNNSNNNISYVKEFAYNQRILMNNIYFLFFSLYKKSFNEKILNRFMYSLEYMYKTNSREYINYDEETFLKKVKTMNEIHFNNINSYEGKLILINLYRIYSRLEVSKNLAERINIILFVFYG